MTKFNLQPGEIGTYQGAKIKIRNFLDLNTVIVENVSTGKSFRVKTSDLLEETQSEKEGEVSGSLMTYTQAEWDEATERYSIIKEALDNPGDGSIIQKIIDESKKNKATIYRWIKKYQEAGGPVGLMEKRGKASKQKLEDQLEEIIKDGIEKVYLKKGERKSIKKVIEYVESKCKKLGLDSPHSNTIRARINQVDEYEIIAARYGKKQAQQDFDPNEGHFPAVNTALQLAQIDHTPLDILLVDPIYRESIGRPWLTTAIDVATRMILGFYLSFDAPSFMSVGLCILNAVLPKEKKLKELGIEGSWPCWGFMQTIHTDNGKEFHSTSYGRACDINKINIEHRPIKTPHWGGHIESWHKTLKHEIHNLPGTTFSNTKERGEYPSEKKAALTFNEFEKWLHVFIVNVYHQRLHSELQSPPIKAWDDSLIGVAGKPGIGFAAFPDEYKTKIDFMPVFYRTIQEYGIANNSINYYSDVLKKWIHRKDKSTGKAELPLKHEFRWDPRDLSTIYFFDMELDQYFKIPYRNLSHPSINIWELKAIKRKLKDIGEKSVDEDKTFRALEEMNAIEEAALSEKKKVKAQRNKARKQNSNPSNHNSKPTKSASSVSIFDEIDVNDLKPFS